MEFKKQCNVENVDDCDYNEILINKTNINIK